MNILVIQTTHSGIYYHRQYTPHFRWRDSGEEFQNDLIVIVETQHLNKLNDITKNIHFDIVLFSIAITKESGLDQFCKYMQHKGSKVVLDIDDRYDKARKDVKFSLGIVDAYTTVSDSLAAYYLERGAKRRPHVIENGIDTFERQFTDMPVANEDVVFGYFGSTRHENDLLVMDYDFKDRQLIVVCEEYSKILDVNHASGLKNWAEYAWEYNGADVTLAPLVPNKFNEGKCIVAGSLVSTTNGILKIEDIVENKINTFTEISKVKNKVSNYFKYEEKPTVKLVTKDGYEIEGTNHHRIMVDGEWRQLDSFSIGDEIELTPPTILQKDYQYMSYPMLLTKNMTADKLAEADDNMIPKIKLNEDWGRFLGYMLGDGTWSGTNGIVVTCDKRHEDVVNDVTSLFKRIGLNPKQVEKKPDKRCKNSTLKEGFGLSIQCTCVTFRKIAHKYGFTGSNGKVFRVPDIILQSPESVIREFLKGLFEADGTIGKHGGLSFTTKDEVLAKQVQYLLLCLGMQSRIAYGYNKIYRKYYYTLHLTRLAADIFIKKVGFVSKNKRDRLKSLTNNKRSNNQKEMTFRSEISHIEYSKNTVYDITVDDVHAYNANGIVNHNSFLKVIEAGFKKKAIICSDTEPYNRSIHDEFKPVIDLIPVGTSWKERIESYTLEEAKQRGEELYKLVQPYDLMNLNKKRRHIYQTIIDLPRR